VSRRPGITVKALSTGVPVCVVLFCRDQFDVARRVEVSDTGVRLPHRRLSAKRLRAAVHRAMTKRAGAQRIARAFAGAGGAGAAADGAGAAADTIEELLPTGTPTANGGAVASTSRWVDANPR